MGTFIFIVVVLVIIIFVWSKKEEKKRRKRIKELTEKARNGGMEENLELVLYLSEQEAIAWIDNEMKPKDGANVALGCAKHYYEHYYDASRFDTVKKWLKKALSLNAELQEQVDVMEKKIEDNMRARMEKGTKTAGEQGASAELVVLLTNVLKSAGYKVTKEGVKWIVYDDKNNQVGHMLRITNNREANNSKYALDMKNIYSKARGKAHLITKSSNLQLLMASDVETYVYDPPEWLVIATIVTLDRFPSFEPDPDFMKDGGHYYANLWFGTKDTWKNTFDEAYRKYMAFALNEEYMKRRQGTR